MEANGCWKGKRGVICYIRQIEEQYQRPSQETSEIPLNICCLLDLHSFIINMETLDSPNCELDLGTCEIGFFF